MSDRSNPDQSSPASRSSLAATWNEADSLWLRNLKVVDPDSEVRGICDLWIRKGILQAVGPSLGVTDAVSVDMEGAVVMPGLFDMHVHLREPGAEDAETIATGALGAARGGFTGVACMPNTPMRCDRRAVVDLILARAREACGTRVYPVAAMTRELEGKELTELAELKEAGAIAASDDGHAIENSEVCRRAMEYAGMNDLPVLAHCEDRALRGQGVMHEGYWSTVLGLRAIPAACEEAGVARDLALAELAGCRLHVCHVSTRGSVELIRAAKARGAAVTAETAPHYLTLSDESLRTYDTAYKMNPPLRTAADMAALREAVRDGTIDCIATDHAPHSVQSKDVEFDSAPFGVLGLETSFGVSYRVLVQQEGMKLEDLVRRMAIAPRRILGLTGGRLTIGHPADLTIVDPAWEWTVDPAHFASKSRNTPFAGWTLPGKILFTMAEGTVTHAAITPSPRDAAGALTSAPSGSRRGS